MTSGVLALIIVGVILAQLAFFVIPPFYRRKQQLQADDGINGIPRNVIPATKPDTIIDPELRWEGFKEFIVEHRLIEDSSNSVCSFHLVPADGNPLPLYRPGQYLTFKLDIEDPKTTQTKTVTRCYSLSDAPHHDYYRVSIKRALPPKSDADALPGLVSNFFHDHIQKGSKLLVKAPAGQFHLLNDEALPIVLIGGGIGITPMLSIANMLLEADSQHEIYLFYGVRNSAEHIMKQHFQTLAQRHKNFHLHVCYSAAGESDIEGQDFHHRGHVDIDLLRSTLKLARYQFYICGPGPMMETMVPALQSWGVDSRDIYFESFGPSTLKKDPQSRPQQPARSVTVHFDKSGKTLSWDASCHSLLEFAEAHNIDVDSSCRSGSCGSCQTEVKTGDIAYHQQPDVEVPEGHCLLCISTPKNNLILNA